MNTLTLYLDQYTNGRRLDKHGLEFVDTSLIGALIDGEDIDKSKYFESALIYFSELEASKSSSGTYLIFTCACGIAEDGGWEGVVVSIEENIVSWEMDVGAEILRYSFDRKEYESEIESMRRSLNASDLPLEPTAVVFPENFHR